MKITSDHLMKLLDARHKHLTQMYNQAGDENATECVLARIDELELIQQTLLGKRTLESVVLAELMEISE